MIYDKIVAFNKKVTTVTDHFLLQEFVCKCGTCNMQKLDLMLPLMLEDLRVNLGKAIRINSAYRCSMWNKAQGGKSDSEHLEGQAVDCYVVGLDGIDVARAAWDVGFRRIGVAEKWVHLGVRDLPKDVEYKIWVYDKIELEKVKKILLASKK